MKTLAALASSLVMVSNSLLASGFVFEGPQTDIVRIVYEKACHVRSFDVTYPSKQVAIAIGHEDGDVDGTYAEPRLTITTYDRNGKRLRYLPSTSPETIDGVDVYTIKRYRSMDSETIGSLKLKDGKGSLNYTDEGSRVDLIVTQCFDLAEPL